MCVCVQNLLSHALFFPFFFPLSILLKTFVCMPCHSMPTRGSRLSPKEKKKKKESTRLLIVIIIIIITDTQ